jgi:short-subunit dehydrogenase
LKKAIVIGVSSGVGRELSRLLAEKGYHLGIAARRIELLHDLKDELSTPTIIRQMDVGCTDQCIKTLSELITEMQGVDLIVFAAGVGDINKPLDWDLEQHSVTTNVLGFMAVANVAMKHFIERQSGHFVAISSIAALRGGKGAPAYNASKAFISNYLEGLRQKVTGLGLAITVTDIKPGFIDTEMAKGDGLFWVAPPRKAAIQIVKGIEKKKPHVYVTKRWRLIAWVLKAMPAFLYNRL